MADTITISGNGTPASASYIKLLTAAEATITTYDPITEASRTEISLVNADLTNGVLTADDINCGYALTGTCKFIDLYDSDDIVLARWTFETEIDLSDTDGYLFTWPEAGVSFDILIEKLLNGDFETGTVGNVPTSWTSGAKTISTSLRNHNYAGSYATHIRPTVSNGCFYWLSTTGTSAASEPDWNTATDQGDTVADGTCVWTCAGSISAANGLIDNTVYYAGSQSMKISGTGWRGISQTINVTVGKIYRITGKIKCVSEDPVLDDPNNVNLLSGIYIYVFLNSRRVGYFYDPLRSMDWENIYLGDYVAVTGDTTLKVEFEIHMADNSALWVDDVSVMEQGAPTANNPRTILHSDADYKLFAANQQDDIYQADAAPGGSPASSITINAVKNERISWQLSVLPTVDWTNVTWSATDFAKGGDTIPAAGLIINRVYYIDVGTALSGNSAYMRSGVSPEALPIEAASDLTNSINNPFFFTVHVPSNAAAGTYTGTLTLVKNGVNQAAVTVNLIVADVSLPDEPIVRSECGVYYYGGESDYLAYHKNMWEHLSYRNSHSYPYGKYWNDASQHFTFDGSDHGAASTFNEECAYFTENMPGYVPAASLVNALGIFADGRYFTINTQHHHVFSDDPVCDVVNPDFVTYFTKYVNDLMDFYESKGINKISVRWRDEASSITTSKKCYTAVAGVIRATGRNIELWADARPNYYDPPDEDNCWDGFYTASHSLLMCADINRRFTYPGVYSNPLMDFGAQLTALKMRLWGWACYKAGLRGNLMWTINAATGTPWTGDYDYFTFIYPPRPGIDTPGTLINSIRYEGFRQGLQDAGLLWMLHDLIQARTGRVEASAIATAQAVLDQVNEVVTHIPIHHQDANVGIHYDQFGTLDLAAVEEVRQNIVDAYIELAAVEDLGPDDVSIVTDLTSPTIITKSINTPGNMIPAIAVDQPAVQAKSVIAPADMALAIMTSEPVLASKSQTAPANCDLENIFTEPDILNRMVTLPAAMASAGLMDEPEITPANFAVPDDMISILTVESPVVVSTSVSAPADMAVETFIHDPDPTVDSMYCQLTMEEPALISTSQNDLDAMISQILMTMPSTEAQRAINLSIERIEL